MYAVLGHLKGTANDMFDLLHGLSCGMEDSASCSGVLMPRLPTHLIGFVGVRVRVLDHALCSVVVGYVLIRIGLYIWPHVSSEDDEIYFSFVRQCDRHPSFWSTALCSFW